MLIHLLINTRLYYVVSGYHCLRLRQVVFLPQIIKIRIMENIEEGRGKKVFDQRKSRSELHVQYTCLFSDLPDCLGERTEPTMWRLCGFRSTPTVVSAASTSRTGYTARRNCPPNSSSIFLFSRRPELAPQGGCICYGRYKLEHLTKRFLLVFSVLWPHTFQ